MCAQHKVYQAKVCSIQGKFIMNHSFDIVIAEKYGVEIAIFLNNIAFWILKNQANDRHFYEGRYWTYNSHAAFLELFPYWSTKNLRTIIKNCLKHELIIQSNFNLNGYDRTLWYALTDKGLSLFPHLTTQAQPHLPVSANRFATSGEPIPDNKQDIKNNNISDNPSFVKTEEVVNAYHETLPESPKIRVIGNQLSYQIKRMQKDWPKYASGKSFTLESFIKFLTIIQTRYPWFLNKYTTDSGNIRQNNLTNITRELNIVKIINGEFSQNE